MDIKLNVYNEDMETVKKECIAKTIKLPFGFIRKMMKLFNVDDLEDTTQILNIVMGSFDEVTGLLSKVFPDVEEDEWDYVDTKELVQVIFQVLKYSFTEILTIPTNSKN